MANYSSETLRNVSIVGHGGSGKTTLTEAMLYTSGAITRLGKVDDGTTTSDYDPDEIKRKMSISTALAPVEWKNYKINILDTPGYADFVAEVISALRVADIALINVCAVSGVEVQTERAWQYAKEYGLPRLVFINRLDKENANFEETLKMAKEAFPKAGLTLFQLPIGKEKTFEGVVDLIKLKAFKGAGKEVKEDKIPENLEAQAAEYNEKLVEAAAETSDELLEKYLDSGTLPEDEIKTALKKGILKGSIIPVLCGSAFKNIGTSLLLDSIVDYFPSPLEHGEIKATNPQNEEVAIKPEENKNPLALVFKTVTDPYIGRLTYFKVYSGAVTADSTIYNATKEKKERLGHLLQLKGKTQEDIKQVPTGDIGAAPKLEVTTTGDTLCSENQPVILPSIKFPEPLFSVAIEPKTRGDEEKLSTSLAKLAEEDPTFTVKRDPETKQTLASGLGDLHLEVIVDRLHRRFGVETTRSAPRIPYKETILAKAKAQGKYKKQTGGRGQYGDTWIEVEPLKTGKGFEFVDKITGGAIPKNYIPSVEKGVKEALDTGLLAGCHIVDIRVTLYDGSYHPVDSSDMAFKIAGSLAFKKAALDAKPVLLEPIVNMEVIIPEQYMGDTIGDLSGKRGKVLGMDARGRNQVVKAKVPLAEVANYASELRSITHGRGIFSIEFSHYEEVPKEIRDKVIAEAQAKTSNH